MQDIISVLLVLSFLGVSWGYIQLCARLGGSHEL